MARILYPALTQPVLVATLDPGTESRWHQPFSLPVRAVALATAVVISSGLFAPVFTPPITVDTWLAPLSQPVLRVSDISVRPSLSFVEADPFPEAVSADRWQQPLAQPVLRLRTVYPDALSYSYFVETTAVDKWLAALSQPRLPSRDIGVHQQPALSFVKAAPFAETVTADRWQQPLAQPTLRLRTVYPDALNYSYYIAPSTEVVTVDKWFAPASQPRIPLRDIGAHQQPPLSFVEAPPFAETVSADRWQQPLAQPVLRLRTTHPDALSYSYFIAETITVDKWLAPLAQPVLRKSDISVRPSLSFVESSPFSETVSADRWQQPFAQPVLRLRTIYPDALSYSYYVETVTLDKWFAPASQPVLRASDISVRPSLSFVEAAPFTETVSIDRWQQSLSQPVLRLRTVYPDALNYSYFIGEQITVDKWLAPLSQPRVPSRDIGAHRQAALFFVKAAPFAEAVSLDRWFSALSTPEPRPRGLPAHRQPFASFVKASPFTEAVRVSQWYGPLSQPVRRQVRITAGESRSPFVPVTAVNLDKWYSAFTQPPRRALSSSLYAVVFYPPPGQPPIIWPADLPQSPLAESYTHTPDLGITRSVMDSGRALHRAAYRARFYAVTCSFIMSSDQLASFRAFAEYELGFSAFFSITLDLDSGAHTVSARLMADKPPTYEYFGPSLWTVSLSLDVLDDPDATIIFASSDWPASLPQNPQTSYRQEPQPGIIRTDLSGYANQRRRFPAAPDKLSTTWWMTGAQLHLFKAWAAYKVGYGTSYFNITLPLDNELREVKARIVPDQPPTYTYLAPNLWKCDLPLEIINPAASPDVAALLEVLSLSDLLALDTALTPPATTLQPFFANYHTDFPA